MILKRRHFMRSTIAALFVFAFTTAVAQDTTKPRTVQVTSSFKPMLKEAAKINFEASPPNTDTSRPRLRYELPNQNLLFAYQPGTLKPLALSVDTGGRFNNWNYVKIGYGGLKTPYFETGLSVGDGRDAGMNIYGCHTSSKGKRNLQDFSMTDIALKGFFKMGGNHELGGGFGVSEHRTNKYGYLPDSLSFNTDSTKVRFQNLSARISLRNIERGEFGLFYAPEIKFDAFNDKLNNSESSMYFNVPLRKTIGGKFEATVGLEANITKYSPDNKSTINNNYLTIAPSVLVKTAAFNINAGIKPTWDNGEFKLFPNVMAEISTPNKTLTVQAGWIGYIRPNTYKSLANYNPWIWAPDFSNNSRIEELYGGLKGALTDHFTYNAKVGINKITNQQYFINDTASGKSFRVVNDPSVNMFNFTGEIGYIVGDKFSLSSQLVLRKYTGVLDAFDKPFGLLPFESKTSLRLMLLRDLYVTSDLVAFDGAWYDTKEEGRGRQKGAIDLNAGLEFGIVRNVKLWAQFNNIMNNEYERWKQYPVYGFNLLGGVVFSFDQTSK